MKGRYYSYILVAVQFICIFYFLFSTSLQSFSVACILLGAGSVILVLLSITSMGWGRLRILPEPKKNTNLVIKGPYRYIRHPMYSSVLLFCLALMVNGPIHITDLVVYGLLLICLLLKLQYEEKLLEGKFPAYTDYKKSSWKLLPFIY